MKYDKISLELNGRTLSVEMGKMGRQADGSVFIRYGDTIMFVAATSKKEVAEPKPFFPLIVDYRENTYAAGKIPGGFFKREGRPSEREILISRLIDRPIRPLFPEGYFNDTQIIALLLSADMENESDTLGIIGASTALYCSDIPFTTPLGAVKIGYINGEFIINPLASQLVDSQLNMVIVGNEEGIIVIEAGGLEVDEQIILDACEAASEPIKRIIQAQKDLFARLNITKRTFEPKTVNQDKLSEMQSRLAPSWNDLFAPMSKQERDDKVKALLESVIKDVPEDNSDEIKAAKDMFYSLEKKAVRDYILNEGRRVDGRGFDDIRSLSIDVGILPRTHGSALFTRGETQCLATVTLGTFEDIQRIDGIGVGEKRFMLHYNFPPFSVGEVGFLRGPGRREIGHGALAEKSILPSIPDNEEEFPYTIRIVSDILESNGSSSMATVCGGVLALMDAGVPLSMVVAGIAIGLVKENDRYAVLTDIAGVEDHFGDMDFKVAGTVKGITAIQMDLKIAGISGEIIREALEKARTARLKVLEKMKEAIPEPRADISPYAPRIITLFINPEKIGEVIGPGGKIIKKITAETGAKIEIEEGGKINIASPDVEAVEKAIAMIKEITVEAEVGKVYTGKVVRLEEYGAFIEILPNIIGLLHISEVAHHRTNNIRDVMRLGDQVQVKVISIDENNKVRVSKKALESPPEGGSSDAPPQRDDRDRSRGSDRPHRSKRPPFGRRDKRDRY